MEVIVLGERLETGGVRPWALAIGETMYIDVGLSVTCWQSRRFFHYQLYHMLASALDNPLAKEEWEETLPAGFRYAGKPFGAPTRPLSKFGSGLVGSESSLSDGLISRQARHGWLEDKAEVFSVALTNPQHALLQAESYPVFREKLAIVKAEILVRSAETASSFWSEEAVWERTMAYIDACASWQTHGPD